MNKISLLLPRILLGTVAATGLLMTTIVKPQEPESPRIGLELRCPNYTVACCEPMTLRADLYGTNEALKSPRSYPFT